MHHPQVLLVQHLFTGSSQIDQSEPLFYRYGTITLTERYECSMKCVFVVPFDAALDNIFEGNYAPVNQTDNPALDEESNPALMYWKDPKDMTKKLIKAYSGEKKSKSASAGMANRDNVFYVDNDDTAEKPDNTGKSSAISNEESDDFYVRENTGNGKTAIIVKSLLILLSVVIFSFSLRSVISFFARGAENGYLLLIPALIGIAVTVIATVYLTKSLILDLQERSVNSDENDIYGEDDGER